MTDTEKALREALEKLEEHADAVYERFRDDSDLFLVRLRSTLEQARIALARSPAPVEPHSPLYQDEDDGSWYVLLNDVFVPAADAEEVPPEKLDEVRAIYAKHGRWGLYEWALIQRGWIPPTPDASPDQ